MADTLPRVAKDTVPTSGDCLLAVLQEWYALQLAMDCCL